MSRGLALASAPLGGARARRLGRRAGKRRWSRRRRLLECGWDWDWDWDWGGSVGSVWVGGNGWRVRACLTVAARGAVGGALRSAVGGVVPGPLPPTCAEHHPRADNADAPSDLTWPAATPHRKTVAVVGGSRGLTKLLNSTLGSGLGWGGGLGPECWVWSWSWNWSQGWGWRWGWGWV